MTFRELYMNGSIEFDEIFDYTSKWNFSDDTRTLREYLGLTATEEDIWISDSDEALEDFMEKEKKIKILFLDLDGTLLNDDKEITSGNHEAIQKALKQGHKIVITTGRPLASAIVLSKELGLTQDGCYAIAFNGAEIYDLYHKKTVFKETLPLPFVRYLLDAAHAQGLHCQTYSDTHILSEYDTPALHRYESLTNLTSRIVPDVMMELTTEPGKVIVIDYENHDKLVHFQESISEWADGKVEHIFSCPQYLELVAPGMSKGHAIEVLCGILGIPKCNTIAAGDAPNDISMLETAAIGVVMNNAADDIKKYGDYITQRDNNHDGIAEVIEKFLLY